MRELYTNVSITPHNFTLSDMFASTEVNQAHALSVCLNELLELKGPNPLILQELESNKYKQLLYPLKI